MNKIITLFLIGLTLVGCEKSSRHQNIFESPICEPPCWENITPGATTKSEALAILSEVDAINQPIFDLKNTAKGFDSELRFSLFGDKSGLRGSVFILENRVSLMDFGTNLDITLQRAIELFGVPESILVFHSNEYWVTLLNAQTGIAFGYSSAGHPDWAYSEIKPEVEISEVMFFNTEQYQQILESGFLSYYLQSADEAKSKLRPWNGYGDLSQYEK
jgi:hypothetical protein